MGDPSLLGAKPELRSSAVLGVEIPCSWSSALSVEQKYFEKCKNLFESSDQTVKADLSHPDEGLPWEAGMGSLPQSVQEEARSHVLFRLNPIRLLLPAVGTPPWIAWLPLTPVVPCVTCSDVTYVRDLILVS